MQITGLPAVGHNMRKKNHSVHLIPPIQPGVCPKGERKSKGKPTKVPF